jgi:hypothetical protein
VPNSLRQPACELAPAASLYSRRCAAFRLRLVLEIDVGKLLAVVVAHDEARRPRPPRYLESLLLHLRLGLLAGANFEPLWVRFTDIMYILWCRVP